MTDMGSMRFQQQAAQTQTTLLQLLLQKYRDSGAPQDEVAYAEHFVLWANKYLQHNRPVHTFAADFNVGVTLESNENVLIAPSSGVEHQGQMLKTPLSPGQRQGIPDVYADQGAVPVTGRAQKPQGSTDYAQYDERNFAHRSVKEDKTVPTPSRDMRRESGGEL